jgi:hypothetical protein
LPNEKQGKGDLSAFILTQMVKYGRSNVLSSGTTTSGLTSYVYSQDKDGFQVACRGNRVAALCNVLEPHFGNPVLSTTNASGLASFVYSINQCGLAINCSLDTGVVAGVTQQVTEFVGVKPGALK